MAIEDSMSITEVLDAGATPENVPERLKLYEAIRKERAEWARDQARINAMNEDVRPPSKLTRLSETMLQTMLTLHLSQGRICDAQSLPRPR